MKITGIGFVYMITSPKGKIYIGSTKNIKYRFSYYRSYDCKNQIKLYNSFKKYGVENHVFEVIWEGHVENMLKYEAIIGIYYQVIENGLNLKLPKINDIYSCMSQETREKISKSNKGKSRSEEFKKRMKLITTGRKHSEESKERMSIIFKGRVVSQETRDKISLSNLNKALSNEHKNKISSSKLGKSYSIEHSNNIGISHMKPIIQLDLQGNFIKEWESATTASKILKINIGHIRSCCKGKLKTIGGFQWKDK